jgi:hypothetical protein
MLSLMRVLDASRLYPQTTPDPRGQHYTAVVDKLTGVGRFQDAYDFLKNLLDC